MAISRPFLLAALGVLLLAATFVAARSGDDSAQGTPSIAGDPAASQPTATTAQTQSVAVIEPDEALSSAFSTEDVKSGRFDASLSVQGPKGAEATAVQVAGNFDFGADDELPKFDVEATVRGLGEDGRMGFVSTGEAGYFTQDGAAYRVPASIWGELSEARGAAKPATPQPAAPVQPDSWLGKAESSPGPQIDGVETTHVSASTDDPRALRDLERLVQPASPVGAGALPGGLGGMPDDAVRSADLDVYVGSDRIVRRVDLQAELGGAARGGSIRMELDLTEVNDPQTVTAPANVTQGLPDGALGLFALGFVQGLAGERPSSPAQLRADLRTADNPRKLQRAVRRGDKAVLFLHNPDAIDDRATAAAVNALRERRGLVVLSDRVGNSDRYGKLVEDLGVSQAPAIVIVDRRGRAHLIEGYVDSASLAQEVADAG